MITTKFLQRFLILFFLMPAVFLSAQNTTTITIGDANPTTISEKYPFDNYYNYAWSNAIYLSSEIGRTGQISQVALYVYNGSGTATNQKIYMRHTSASSYTTGTFPGETGFTLVYSGSITYNFSSSGWQTINLTTPFQYNGTDNLEFLFENQSGSYLSYFPYFYVTTTAANRVRRDFKDASFPSTCSSCGAYAYIPNIKLTIGCATTMSVISTPTVVCAGSSSALAASGVSSYTWSPSPSLSSSTGASVTASPTASTTYTITGKDANSCVQTQTLALTVNAAPSLSLNPSAPAVCIGSGTSITGSGANTYTWSPASSLNVTTGATVSANPTVTTAYTLTAKSSSGCSATKAFTVTVNPLPTIAISPIAPVVCSGSSTTLNGSGASTYSWSPSSALSSSTGSSVSASPTIATNYTLTGTDANGCIGSKTFSVAVNTSPSLTIMASSSTICAGNSSTLTASGGTSYTWSPSASLSGSAGSSVTATPTVTTTYTLTGSNATGCITTKTITVNVNTSPVITISPASATLCTGSNTTLTASGSNTYTWNPATGLNVSTGATVTANPTVSTTYSVAATSTAGCISNKTVAITVNSLPSVSISPSTTTVCNGGITNLAAGGAATYSWNPAAGLNNTTGSTVTANPAGNTVYTVTATNSSGCQGTATATVNVSSVNPGTALASGGTVTCTNNVAALSLDSKKGTTVATGTLTTEKYPFDGYYDYSWSEAIYLASELGGTGTLSKLSFYVDNVPANYVMNSQKIYIKTTSATSFTNANYPGTTGFTLVYSGNLTINGSGWLDIPLSSNFTYDGTSNLDILFENRDGSWANGFPLFRYNGGYANMRVRRDFQDASFPTSCANCAMAYNVPQTKFTFDRTLGTFVKWQSSTDNINYTDISGGTTQNYTTSVNTSTYFRAQVSGGSCPAAYSDPAYYATSNNYYVNDNATTGDVFTSSTGNSSNDGRSSARPQSSVNYILTNYVLGPCDTIFVDKGNYTEEIDIYYGDGGNKTNYTTIHGAGIDQTILTASSNHDNIFFGQADYVKVEGFTMNSSQSSYSNIYFNEAEYNNISNNKLTHSGTTNISVYGDNINASGNIFSNNTISNSSTSGSAIIVEGNADSTQITGNTISLSNPSSPDAVLFISYAGSSSVYYPVAGVISNNNITAYSYGVSVFGQDNSLSNYTISSNTITLLGKAQSDGAPVWLAGVGTSTLTQSNIYNNRLIGGKNGIYTGSNTGYAEIYNNYISGSDYGVYSPYNTATNIQLYFNSFYTSLSTLKFASGANSGWKVKDNILYTNANTTAEACINNAGNTKFTTCNYNLFYAPNGAVVGKMNGTNYPTLTSWKAIAHATETSFGDENSLYGNPSYSNIATNNLDISGTSTGAFKGVAVTGIGSDIYGLSRTTTPSIGADEPSEASSVFYFRSAQSGNWNNVSTWQASPDSINWVTANIYPTYLQRSINIQANHTVTISASISIDEVVVNGTLVYGNNSGSDLTIADGAGTDLVVNGTFVYSGPDSTTWQGAPSWKMGNSGTMIVNNNNTGLGWKNNYQGGISVIPAAANWVLNKTSAANPFLITTADMYYPNLTIQNNSGSTWTTTTGSIFTGSASAPTIKGALNIGGSGANAVVFVNQNTNASPVNINGDLIVQSGSTLQNNGTGFNVQGNLTVNGSFTGTKNLFFSGTNNQTLSGASFSEIAKLTLNKAGGLLTLNSPVMIDNSLTLTNGYIATTTANILTINNGATVSGAGNNSFITGPLKKIGNTAFSFPTGKNGNYQPIGISAPANATDAFIAEYFHTPQSFGTSVDSNLAVGLACEYWDLTEASGTSTVNVTAGWNASSCNTDSASNMRMAYSNGNGWKSVTNRIIGGILGPIIGGPIVFPFPIIGPIHIILIPYCKGSVSITSSNGTTFCQGQQTTLTANVPGSFWWAGASYSWNTTPVTSGNTLSVNTSGTYAVTATTPAGCSSTRSVGITVNPSPALGPITSQAVCSGNTVNAVNFSTTPASGVTVSWTNSGSTAGGIATSGTGNIVSYPAPNVSSPSIASLSAIAALGSCHSAPVNFNITVSPGIAANAGPDQTIIAGNSATLNGSATGGTGTYTYQWQPGAGNTASISTGILTTTTTYDLTVSDGSCSSTDNVIVFIISGGQYAELKRTLDGGYYQLTDSKLYFTIDGEYNHGILSYKIYDYKRAAVNTSSLILTRDYGDNRYSVDLSTVGFTNSNAGKYYTLEITNEKNEKFYLKFRYKI